MKKKSKKENPILLKKSYIRYGLKIEMFWSKMGLNYKGKFSKKILSIF